MLGAANSPQEFLRDHRPVYRGRNQLHDWLLQNRGALTAHPLPCHSCAGGGAVHSITSGLMTKIWFILPGIPAVCSASAKGLKTACMNPSSADHRRIDIVGSSAREDFAELGFMQAVFKPFAEALHTAGIRKDEPDSSSVRL